MCMHVPMSHSPFGIIFSFHQAKMCQLHFLFVLQFTDKVLDLIVLLAIFFIYYYLQMVMAARNCSQF